MIAQNSIVVHMALLWLVCKIPNPEKPADEFDSCRSFDH